MVRRAGACVALLGFAASLVVGTWVGNPVTVVLQRALWTLLACFLVGLLAARLAERVIQEHVSRHEKELLDSLESPQETQEQSESTGEEPVGAARVRSDGAGTASAVPLGR